MTKPSTASPRNSSDSLSITPPLTSSLARDGVRQRVLEQAAVAEAVADAASSGPNSSRAPDAARGSSSRWLSMMRARPRPSSAPTAMRTSPRPLTVTGNTRVAHRRRADGMPCASSRPRTIWPRRRTSAEDDDARIDVRGSRSARGPHGRRRPRQSSTSAPSSCRRAAARRPRTPSPRAARARGARRRPGRRAPRRAGAPAAASPKSRRRRSSPR